MIVKLLIIMFLNIKAKYDRPSIAQEQFLYILPGINF